MEEVNAIVSSFVSREISFRFNSICLNGWMDGSLVS
ncbi:uncharacterized protein [Blastocystis hominis]|uniref:Uncharacterized protein n=1 Tax=Blastocystis hominis TaxID=12968 RepID=D8LUZ7_BLAHO|nr:uncharacterized protein [Blastocystis hominis]CBK19636.2 unnamed protein product [Blastocystis hominis]|eukprot:XP_012893684.1 uncharacterized protein [Blastocystis hominis]